MMKMSEREDSLTLKFGFFAITCLSYGITFTIAEISGAVTYTWIGGAFTFVLFGIMIRQVFGEVSLAGAYCVSAFFCMIIMFPLNLQFSVLMGIIFVCILVIGIALEINDNQRYNERY